MLWVAILIGRHLERLVLKKIRFGGFFYLVFLSACADFFIGDLKVVFIFYLLYWPVKIILMISVIGMVRAVRPPVL